MYGYLCFYKGKTFSVMAATSAEAQRTAAAHFKAKKAWEVHCALVMKIDGTEVLHNGASL